MSSVITFSEAEKNILIFVEESIPSLTTYLLKSRSRSRPKMYLPINYLVDLQFHTNGSIEIPTSVVLIICHAPPLAGGQTL